MLSKFVIYTTTGLLSVFSLLSLSKAVAECDISNVIFSPSHKTIEDSNSWFRRGGQSKFTVEIVGNGGCSGVTLQDVTLSNTHGVNNDIEAFNDVKIRFNNGSNKIKIYFEAGEEGCTAMIGKADCHLELFVESPATKDGYWSGGNLALLKSGYEHGKLKYECDERFSTCNNSIEFKLLKIEGGEIVQ